MFSNVRKRFTYANVAATLALVFAMSGGAYAASKYLVTSTKQISPKVLKSLRGKSGAAGPAGKAGATGAQGPAGTQGPAGPQGPAGKGEKGEPGQEGKAGANGESVTVKALGKGQGGCTEGGSEFSNKAGKASACNGLPGAAGGVLPAGKTETGEWDISTYDASAGRHTTAVSFALPLGKAPSVHYINPNRKEDTETGEQTSTVCLGTVDEPKAEAGNLCVYDNNEVGISENETINHEFTGSKWGVAVENVDAANGAADTFGFRVMAFAIEEGVVEAVGSWAVTAEES